MDPMNGNGHVIMVVDAAGTPAPAVAGTAEISGTVLAAAVGEGDAGCTNVGLASTVLLVEVAAKGMGIGVSTVSCVVPWHSGGGP